MICIFMHLSAFNFWLINWRGQREGESSSSSDYHVQLSSHSQFIATVRNQGCFSLVSATWGLNGVSLGCFSAGPWFPPLRMPISLLWVLLSYRQFLLNSLYFSSSCLSKWDEFFHVFVLKTVQQYNLHVVWGPPGFVWFFPSKRWTNGKSNMFEE